MSQFPVFVGKNSLQVIDQKSGLLFPWYVPDSLEFFKDRDISQWEIFEWGGGSSTIWYAYNAKHVDVLEANKDWAEKISIYILNIMNQNNYSVKYIDVKSEEAENGSQNKPTPNMQEYLSYIKTLGKTYDCIIIDGSYRDEAIVPSLECIKDGGYIIFDNYEQDTSGYLTLKNKNLLNKHPNKLYQHGEWKTKIWRIENEYR